MTATAQAADHVMRPVGRGMTALEHREHYGFDLSWVQLRGSDLVCVIDGERVPVRNAASWADKRLLCEGFVHDHAGCVRIAAKPRRA